MSGFRDKDAQYVPLQHDTDRFEDNDEALESPQIEVPLSKPRRRSFVLIWFAWILSCIFFAFFGGITARKLLDMDRRCAAYTSQRSPVLTNVDIHYSVTRFNGSFMQENVYRRAGNPETDAAWDALGVNYRAGIIPVEDGLRSGLSPAHVQRADKYGGGFFVNVEGMHHLHCLNLVRKSLYYNYEYYKEMGMHAFKNEERILQLHISHCVDIIRQTLMCNVDTGVLGQVWAHEDKPAAFPDFNTDHKCKNYDAVRQFAEKIQAPPEDSLPPEYLKLPGDGDVLSSIP